MMDKRFEGRDEPILDPDLPIIDAHHHLFTRPGITYLLDDFLADAQAGHKIVASVAVEILAFARKDGPEHLRPLGEIEYLNGVGAMAATGVFGPCRAVSGIVGYADLRFGEQIGELLDQSVARAPDRFRGVRQNSLYHDNDIIYNFITHAPPRGLLQHPNFRAGFREVAKRGLNFDCGILSNQIVEMAELADDFPNTSFMLDHLGMTMCLGMEKNDPRRKEEFDYLRASLREAGKRPNVHCKIGGFGLPFWNFGLIERPDPIGYLELAETWAPYVEIAIEAFGPERCMMESNFPMDGRACGYVPLWNALKHIVRGYSANEKAALFHRTAKRVYRLDLPDSLFI